MRYKIHFSVLPVVGWVQILCEWNKGMPGNFSCLFFHKCADSDEADFECWRSLKEGGVGQRCGGEEDCHLPWSGLKLSR